MQRNREFRFSFPDQNRHAIDAPPCPKSPVPPGGEAAVRFLRIDFRNISADNLPQTLELAYAGIKPMPELRRMLCAVQSDV